MRLIIAGCEYSGTTTLADEVRLWAEEAFGRRCDVHDHWKFPHIACYPLGPAAAPLTDEEQEQVLALAPKLKEMLQRQSMVYHYPSSGQDADCILVGYHFEDAVYGPLYFKYGLEDEPQGGPRSRYARRTEVTFMKRAPETTLVLLKAAPEVIARRLRESPRHNGVLQEEDIERVLERFDEEYALSVLVNKFTLDTSTATPQETLQEFKRQFQPFMTDADRVRILI